jgi:hypothetical protein
MGSFSSESVGANYFRSSSSSVKSPPPSPGLESSASLDSPIVNTHSHVSRPTAKELEKNERYQENKEQLDRMQGEVRQQIRELLRLIGVRDQVLTASRRAHQLLNKQCKGAIGSILRKLVDREREGIRPGAQTCYHWSCIVSELSRNYTFCLNLNSPCGAYPGGGQIGCCS